MDVPSADAVVAEPSATLSVESAWTIVAALERDDVSAGGVWRAEPGRWHRFGAANSRRSGLTLVGTITVLYDVPLRHNVTIHRATLTDAAVSGGWTVEALCDDALGHAGLSLQDCPQLEPTTPHPPDPFRRWRAA